MAKHLRSFSWLVIICLVFSRAGSAEDAPAEGKPVAEKKSEAKSNAENSASEKSAEESGDEEKAAKEKAAEEKAKQFKIPEDAKPDELMKLVELWQTQRIRVKTREEFLDHHRRLAEAVVKATDMILDAKDVDEDVAFDALTSQFSALNVQKQLEVEGAAAKEKALAKKYVTDSREKFAKLATEKVLFSDLQDLKSMELEAQKELLGRAVKYVKDQGKPSRKTVRTAMQIGDLVEEFGGEGQASVVYSELADFLANESDDKEIARLAAKMKGIVNRLRLIGNPLELEGLTINGETFDWKAYEGKVVLVDFWATWCGPCIAELPNVKSNYKAYKSKGFDVVGISLDESKEKLENFISKNKLEWTNLFSEDEMANGWDHPLATKFGVMGIPFTILVGKDGKVVKTNVRGPALRAALTDMLGAPDESATEDDDQSDDKKKDDKEEAKPGEKKE